MREANASAVGAQVAVHQRHPRLSAPATVRCLGDRQDMDGRPHPYLGWPRPSQPLQRTLSVELMREDPAVSRAPLPTLEQKMVGAAGFEPTTLCPPGRCATRLRYAPTCCEIRVAIARPEAGGKYTAGWPAASPDVPRSSVGSTAACAQILHAPGRQPKAKPWQPKDQRRNSCRTSSSSIRTWRMICELRADSSLASAPSSRSRAPPMV